MGKGWVRAIAHLFVRSRPPAPAVLGASACVPLKPLHLTCGYANDNASALEYTCWMQDCGTWRGRSEESRGRARAWRCERAACGPRVPYLCLHAGFVLARSTTIDRPPASDSAQGGLAHGVSLGGCSRAGAWRNVARAGCGIEGLYSIAVRAGHGEGAAHLRWAQRPLPAAVSRRAGLRLVSVHVRVRAPYGGPEIVRLAVWNLSR